MDWEELGLPCFVISVPSSLDRRTRVQRRLADARIKFEFIDAIDGTDPRSVQAAFECRPDLTPPIFMHRAREISNPELSCTLSHMKAIRTAYNQGFERILICEDDVIINGVQIDEFAHILGTMPENAACVQLGVTPTATIDQLYSYQERTGHQYAAKRLEQPVKFADPELGETGCHCTVSYIMTRRGMRAICEKYFENDVVLFPCSADNLRSNAGLLSDRFIYQICASAEFPAYVYCIPTLSFYAEDSLLNPGRLENQIAARDKGRTIRQLMRKL